MSKDIIPKKPQTVAPGITNIEEYKENNFNIENSNVSFITNNVYSAQNSDNYDENGKPLTPIAPTRYDKEKHIIYLGNAEIRIPVELESEELLRSDDLPYINALCEVFAEKLNKAISPKNLDELPSRYKKEMDSHKQAFYGAEYIHHSVREVFADGEQQFQNLKDDAYQGIEMTYLDDSHATGYERLKAVLNKITNTTLTGSNLTNIIGMITNLEKKGICHILVNDDVIKSWVNVDE